MIDALNWFFKEFAYQNVWFYVISSVCTFAVIVYFAYQKKKDPKYENEGEGFLVVGAAFLWYLVAAVFLTVGIWISIRRLADLTAVALVNKSKPPTNIKEEVQDIKEKMGYDNLPKMG